MIFCTILCLTCLFIGFGQIVRKLIERGADLNAENDDHNSAIICAALEGKKLKSIHYSDETNGGISWDKMSKMTRK